jgi:hypothetical protein
MRARAQLPTMAAPRWTLKCWRRATKTIEEESNVALFSHDASILHRFVNACSAVRENSPQVACVHTKNVRGYGRYLGEALQGNTHVSFLELYLLPEEVDAPGMEGGIGSIALIVQYLQEGPALRRVSLNSGTLAHMRLCVHAISQNSNVEDLTIASSAAVPSEEVASLLIGTQSKLKFLSMPVMADMQVANAMANNQTLETLALSCVGPRPSGLIFKALHANEHLRELGILQISHDRTSILSDVEVALSLYLSRTKTLSTLFLHDHIYGRESTQRLVDGLRSNTSLSKIALSRCSFDAEAVEVLRAFTCVVGCGSIMKTIRALLIQGSNESTSMAAVAALIPIFPALHVLDCSQYHSDDDSTEVWKALASKPIQLLGCKFRLPCSKASDKMASVASGLLKLDYLQACRNST